MSLPPFDRPTALARLADEHFDVLVVGGGITGAGVALDAATRGLRTALVERDDFASGTSSKSSKLVHGGLRYLQQRRGRPRLRGARRAPAPAQERAAPRAGAAVPHPGLRARTALINPKLARALGSAMWMYDLTGGAAHRQAAQAHRRRTRRSRTCRRCRADRLAAAYLYYDAQADDARLTLDDRPHRGVDHGAVVANDAARRRLRQGRRRPASAARPSRPTARDDRRARRAPS